MENNNFCTCCGAKLEEDANFCISCGNPIKPKIVMPQIKTASWWIMGAFFGAFIILALICFVI